jgi:DNA-binding transcriptional MocR family regulator
VGSLQGLALDRVVTIGTVSKSLAPALRLGWVLSPAELTELITDHTVPWAIANAAYKRQRHSWG